MTQEKQDGTYSPPMELLKLLMCLRMGPQSIQPEIGRLELPIRECMRHYNDILTPFGMEQTSTQKRDYIILLTPDAAFYLYSPTKSEIKSKNSSMIDQERESMIQPIFDRILVRLEEDREKVEKKGSLFVPQQSKEMQGEPKTAIVVATGSGKPYETASGDRPMTVKVGQRVYMSRYAGAPITIDGVDHLIVLEGDILAVEDV